jgi:hypothetical protein
LDWAIIGGDKIVLRILSIRRTKVGKILFDFFYPNMTPFYLLKKIIVFPEVNPLTTYRKMFQNVKIYLAYTGTEYKRNRI